MDIANVDGSNIDSAGEAIVRDATCRDKFLVQNTITTNAEEESSTSISAHVAEPIGTTNSTTATETETVRETFKLDATGGNYTIGCFKKEQELEEKKNCPTLLSKPTFTKIFTDDVTASVDKGLSFDSDQSAIYFGASKEFRIKYSTDTPQRLLFQYLQPSTQMYVTKFSCTK